MKHIKKRYVIIGMLIIAAAAGSLFVAQYYVGHSTSNQTETTSTHVADCDGGWLC